MIESSAVLCRSHFQAYTHLPIADSVEDFDAWLPYELKPTYDQIAEIKQIAHVLSNDLRHPDTNLIDLHRHSRMSLKREVMLCMFL